MTSTSNTGWLFNCALHLFMMTKCGCQRIKGGLFHYWSRTVYVYPFVYVTRKPINGRFCHIYAHNISYMISVWCTLGVHLSVSGISLGRIPPTNITDTFIEYLNSILFQLFFSYPPNSRRRLALRPVYFGHQSSDELNSVSRVKSFVERTENLYGFWEYFLCLNIGTLFNKPTKRVSILLYSIFSFRLSRCVFKETGNIKNQVTKF